MKTKHFLAPALLMFALSLLSGCENMNIVRQSLEDVNKVLAPLAVLKKGSGS